MILCALCGMERTDDGGPICPWHTALGATWGAENRIWCDFVHRGIVPRRIEAPVDEEGWCEGV